MHIIQADERRSPYANPSWDQPLRLYYDETNNIRRLTLSEVGLNNVPERMFALAGIALKPGKEIVGWDMLRREMGVQVSATEIKYKHVAPPDYEAALASEKLTSFLEWLTETETLIHYSVLDVLFWSVLDIIESLMADERVNINEIHMELKNELVFAVKVDPIAFMTLAHEFGYPNLKRADVPTFLKCVLAFVERRLPVNRNRATHSLKKLLRGAAKLPRLELPFLHDNEPGELISDFSAHFMHVLCIFKHASHILDCETNIERILQKFEIRNGERRLDYRFSDSKSEIGIQASDVIAGLIGRHFTYILGHSLQELIQALDRFSERQHKNLGLLRRLIDASNAYSNGLLHAIQPLDTGWKNDAFLHGRPAPDFLGR